MYLKVLFLSVLCLKLISGQKHCSDFQNIKHDVSEMERNRNQRDKILESKGFLMSETEVGYERGEILTCRNCTSRWYNNPKGDLYTAMARLVADKNISALNSFGEFSECLQTKVPTLKSHKKYRSINGYGNNLKKPFLGSTGTTFGRFAPKNYNDGVHSTRRSVIGNYLPNPRKIVKEILLKAEKLPRLLIKPNTLTPLLILYITHDVAHQVPVAASTKCEEARCCTKGNGKILSKSMRSSSCLPIAISDDDDFYKKANVGCLNMIRSDMSSSPDSVEFGEIKNRATAFLDISLVYGVEESETREIRSFSSGKLNMNSKNILPTDKNGNYTRSSDRLMSVPTAAIWPVFFARHHNQIADGLSKLNPKWNDEKLFLEARRINIAVAQSNIIELVQYLFQVEGRSEGLYRKYDENADPSIWVEFSTAAYRFFHYFVKEHVDLVDKENNLRQIPLSDTFGRIDILENNFADVLRGTLKQQLNDGEYTDEIFNKFAKNKNGVGIDVLSMDIQRGRDHGLPTYLETRKKCGLSADFKSFDDLLAILSQSSVDLLRNVYDDVKDIDLYVGGGLESFMHNNTKLAGHTFGCIIYNQYRALISSDAYFYAHTTNPYPFTESQIESLHQFKFNNLMCQTSDLGAISPYWFFLEDIQTNPLYPCVAFGPLDLNPWKNI